MKTVLLSLLILAAVVGGVISASRRSDDSTAPASTANTTADRKPVPVLVELFTSEGCSSCPPADKLLTQLDETQPVASAEVIVLSEHVDYWNRLGWTDPFSSAEFSQRQSEYAQAFGGDDIYTPQMIVDGRMQFVGSNSSKARDAIAAAARNPKGAVSITVKEMGSPGRLSFKVYVEGVPQARGDQTSDVFLAITESGLQSNVARGENSGKRLAHTAVTRKLIRLGELDGPSFTAERVVDIDGKWKRENLKAVSFVQARDSRHVLGVTAIKLSNGS
jgi:hypothetical protein